jgi:Zn finger protein HypA/HybF involved in hydrogenase expression
LGFAKVLEIVKDLFECPACGHKHEIVAIPSTCPACGGGAVMPVKTEAQIKTEALNAKFRLAANRAKGNF